MGVLSIQQKVENHIVFHQKFGFRHHKSESSSLCLGKGGKPRYELLEGGDVAGRLAKARVAPGLKWEANDGNTWTNLKKKHGIL